MAASAKAVSLYCEHLDRSFGGVQALDDFGLAFPESGISAIIGPNGAGKTTLLNVITGFLRPDSGSVFLGNREITCLAPYKIARSGLARTFQDLRLIQLITVLDNVMLARPRQKGEKLFYALFRFGIKKEEERNREKAMELLDFVGLANKANDPAGEISYGHQKLLTLACCLATEANILLLDEPVSGVHPKMIEKILGLLTELRAQGKQIIFIEHDLAAVRKIADEVIVMDDGKVVARGTPSAVLDRPEMIKAYVG